MGIVEDAKRLYGAYIDADTQRVLDELGPGDQAYFWARLYYEIPRSLGKAVLEDMERSVSDGTARLRPMIGDRHAYDATSPHAWFKVVADDIQ